MRTNKAFTLIELLTVIAIIGILASILIPVVGSVRDSAKSSVCQSHLRQWHTAMLLHANDNDDRLVAVRYSTDNTGLERGPGQFWSGRLAAYMELRPPLWGRQSPLVHDTVGECPSTPWRDRSTYISYGASGISQGTRALYMWDHEGSRSLINVEPRTIVFGDCGPDFSSRSFSLGGRGQRLAYRHKDRANVVMMGGNVESFHVDDKIGEEEELWRYDR